MTDVPVCRNGHLQTPDNLAIRKDGNGVERIRCRVCELEAGARRREKSRRHRAKRRGEREARVPTIDKVTAWLENATPPQPLVRTRPNGWPNSWILRYPDDDMVHRLWWGDHHLACGADVLLASTAAPAGLPPCEVCWGGVIGDGAVDVGAFRTPTGERRSSGVRPVPDSAVAE